MRTLVVYHSEYGGTRRIAEEIARAAGADTEVLGVAESGGGQMGYQPQGLLERYEPEQIAALRHNPEDYDVIAIGTPTQGHHVPDPVRSFAQMYRDRLKDVAFFVVAEQGEAAPVLRELGELVQRRPVAEMAVQGEELTPSDQQEIARFADRLRH